MTARRLTVAERLELLEMAQRQFHHAFLQEIRQIRQQADQESYGNLPVVAPVRSNGRQLDLILDDYGSDDGLEPVGDSQLTLPMHYTGDWSGEPSYGSDDG